MKRDTYYDYIRAFAALLVLFTHKGKLPGGSIGVSIFFCLSGFLIARILIGLPAISFSNIGKFIFRRWMRVYPLYAAAIIATYIMVSIFKPGLLDDFVSYIPGMLTFTRFSWTGFSTGVFWTLHAEFWFYVTFPFIFAFAFKRGLLLRCAIALIVVSLLAKIYIGHAFAYYFTPLLTLIYLDQLMFGVVCALLIHNQSKVLGLFRSKWWFWGGLTINLAISKFCHHRSFDFFWYLETSGAALICAIAILHHAARPTEFKNNFIAWIGRISFSIYLVHGIVLDYLPAHEIPEKLDTPSFVVIVLIISYFTERFIERPGIRLSKRIAKFRGPAEPITAEINRSLQEEPLT